MTTPTLSEPCTRGVCSTRRSNCAPSPTLRSRRAVADLYIRIPHPRTVLPLHDRFLWFIRLHQAAKEEEANGAGDKEATSLLKSMSSRASRVESEITRRLRSEFAGLVKPQQQGATAGSTGALGGDVDVDMPFRGRAAVTGEESGAVRERKRQAILSCLRPFSALGSGMEAEKQFVRCAFLFGVPRRVSSTRALTLS